MKNSIFILVLLLLSFNNVELNLSDIASKIIKDLFNISFSFSVSFEEEMIIRHTNPKIKVKLSASVNKSINNNNVGSIKLKSGIVIDEKGIDLNFDCEGNDFIIDFKKNIFSLTKKLKELIEDGIININFSFNRIEITIIIADSKNNDSYEGTITIIIENEIPTLNEIPKININFKELYNLLHKLMHLIEYKTEINYQKKTINEVAKTSAIEVVRKTHEVVGTITENIGTISVAVGTVVLYKLVKTVPLLAVAGPAGGIIGLLT